MLVIKNAKIQNCLVKELIISLRLQKWTANEQYRDLINIFSFFCTKRFTENSHGRGVGWAGGRGGEEFCEVLWKVLGQALGPHWLQLGHGCRPFSLQEMHLRALKESVKQLRNTDILLPWHMGHGMKAKPPQDWHGWWCWALWEGDTRSSQGIGNSSVVHQNILTAKNK